MQEGCTLNQSVRYLSKKWMFLIILELYKGEAYTRRFSELRLSLDGITPKVLSERLKELENEGILTRRIETSVFPVRSEYSLTESGLDLVGVIRDIKRWALKWKIDNLPCGEQDCKDCIL